MKLVRFQDSSGKVLFGCVAPGNRARPAIDAGFPPVKFDDQTVEVSTLLPPASPPNIFAIGRNYREHAAEMKAAAADTEPLIFIKATTSLIAAGQPIILPTAAPSEVDFEAELAIIIGRHGKNIPVERALDYVLGYSCANDVSARDCQRTNKQWARAKSFDTFCPLGPCLVTADDLRPDDLLIRSILNGQVMQESRTSEMIFPPAQLVSYISHQFTLLPGTLILTGTPAGVGAARTPPVFLRPGDEISIEIEGIGRLTNPVRADLED